MISGSVVQVDPGSVRLGALAVVDISEDGSVQLNGQPWPSEDYATPQPLEPQGWTLFTGRADLELKDAAATVRFALDPLRVELLASPQPGASAAKVDLNLDAFAPFAPGSPHSQRLPIFGGDAFLFALSFPLADEQVLLERPLGGPLRLSRQATLTGTAGLSAQALLPDLAGPLADGLDLVLQAAQLTVEPNGATVEWADGGVAIQGLALSLPAPLELRARLLNFGLDSALLLGAAGGPLTLAAQTTADTWLADDPSKPFTLRIPEGAELGLAFRPEGPTLVGGSAEAPLGVVYVPGIEREEGESAVDFERRAQERFQLQLGVPIDPEDPRFPETPFAIGPGGLQLQAKAFGEVTLPRLENVRSSEGWLMVDHGAWAVEIGADFSLPWFSGADGSLTVSAGSLPGKPLQLSVAAQVVKEVDWGVSYGPVSARAERVGLDIGWTTKKDTEEDTKLGWQVDGFLDGAFRFNAKRFGRGAGKWLGALFSGVEIAFSNLTLQGLANLASGDGTADDLPEVELRLLRPVETRLFSVFGFTLNRLKLTATGLVIGGDLSIKAGPAVFSGSLPALAVGFEDGKPTLDLGDDGPGFRFSGSLVVAGGVRGAMSIDYRDDDLIGEGALTIPGVTSLDVVVAIGRWTDPQGRKHASFGFFGELGDLKLQLLPGVTLMSLGVGIGVHRTLKGTDGLASKSMDEIAEWLRDNPQLPDPKVGANWVRDANPFMLVASANLMATPTAKAMQAYIARMILMGNARLELMAFGHAWLLALPAEVESLEPTARGVLAFEPRTPSVNAALLISGGDTTLTKDNPLLEMLVAPFFASGVEVAFSADPDRFRLRVGPSGPPPQEIAGLTFEASTTGMVEITRSPARVALGIRMAASASFEQAFGFDAGIVRAEVRFSARGGFDLRAAGAFTAADDAGTLTIFGQCRLWAAFHLSLSLTLELWLFDVTFEFSLGLSADLDLQLGARASLGTEPEVNAGFIAKGRLTFHLMGFELEGSVNLADERGVVDGLRGQVSELLGVEP